MQLHGHVYSASYPYFYVLGLAFCQCFSSHIYFVMLVCFALYYYIRKDLVPAYVRLLRDNEAEVRIAAAGKVTKFCQILSPELAILHILPCVKVHLSLSLSLTHSHVYILLPVCGPTLTHYGISISYHITWQYIL